MDKCGGRSRLVYKKSLLSNRVQILLEINEIRQKMTFCLKQWPGFLGHFLSVRRVMFRRGM